MSDCDPGAPDPCANLAKQVPPLTVLLIAYACEPGRGSEPGTGWNMALGLANLHDVTVATRANNRAVIEQFLEKHPVAAPRFLYIDPPLWALILKALHVMPVQLFYLFWQLAVARALKKQGEDFDILHQLTFNSFEIPPLAFRGSSALKIWGPMGGAQVVSGNMLRAFGTLGGLKEWLRNLRVQVSAKNPWVANILHDCSLVLFANHETRQLLAPATPCETGMMIDVGVDMEKFSPPVREENNAKITLLSAGRLEERKGVILLLDAFAALSSRHEQIELRVVGTGPLHLYLRNEVSKRGLNRRVIFTGSVNHDIMNREFAKADIFVFPSLRDTSGAVVLEAMAMALPVVCFDHQGAALMVENGCGIRVPPSLSYDSAVESLTGAIETLILDGDLRRRCGRNGRKAVEKSHDWKVKVGQISSCYNDLVTRRASN